MYLTRFRINTARTGARRLLASPQSLHAAVLASFAEPLAADYGPRPRWRIDQNSRHETLLYLVSPTKPDLTHLVEQAGWPTTGGWDSHEYGPFLDQLRAGTRWKFRLTANPVHSIRRSPEEPTKVTAHVTPHHQLAWLVKKQETAGFRVVERAALPAGLPPDSRYELLVHQRRNLSFRKRAQDAPVTLATATFDGQLEVTDAETFRRTLTQGIGRAKAYGCGLMTLAPL